MTRTFTADQSSEIDDRIVQMIVAVLGEGDAARRCRVIANERYLDNVPEIPDPAPTRRESNYHQPLPSEGSGVLSDADEALTPPIHTEQAQ